MDDTLIHHVLAVAPLPEADMRHRIGELGVPAVAEAVLREVLDRVDVAERPADPIRVQWDIGFDGGRHGFVLTVGPGGGSVEAGPIGTDGVIFRQDLTEMIRALFTADGPCDATREVHIRLPYPSQDPDPSDPDLIHRTQATQVARSIVRSLSPRPAGLTELAVRFGSDKWGVHAYTPVYDRYFSAFRDRPVTMLEIGIGGSGAKGSGGASLRMWKHYFRAGRIYGLDIYDKSHVDEPRVKALQGDQGDPVFLDKMAAELGPFDIIIDDGSHINEHVITSFQALYPHLKPGGLYVVEDTETAYWPGWGGNSTDLNDPSTSLGFFKRLVDGLNHEDVVRDGEYEPSLTDLTTTAVHFHRDLVIVEKGVNAGHVTPEWIKRAESALFL